MHPVRRQRLFIVLFIVVGASAAAGLIFYALSENLNLFYSPTQINDGEAPQNQRMRAGGMVREGSVVRAGDSLKISFEEGQGVVVTGKLDDAGVMQAEEVLAKHDEEYMPPEVQEALDNAKELGKPSPAYKGNY
jgi:cytochrome c-type biogenesis protein CcmE